jgi:hypothetical protein
MYKTVNIDELIQEKQEIYELYKTDKKLYHSEYDRICKKVKYWTNERYRKNKNENDNLRNTINRYNNKYNRVCVDVV